MAERLVFENEKLVGEIIIHNRLLGDGGFTSDESFLRNVGITNIERIDGIVVDNVKRRDVVYAGENNFNIKVPGYGADIYIIKRNFSLELFETIAKEITSRNATEGAFQIIITYDRFRKNGYIESGYVQVDVKIESGEVIIDKYKNNFTTKKVDRYNISASEENIKTFQEEYKKIFKTYEDAYVYITGRKTVYEAKDTEQDECVSPCQLYKDYLKNELL